MSVSASKTALALRATKWRGYHLRPKVISDEARYRRAWEIAHTAAEVLRQQFGVLHISAFGSLTSPSRFSSRSDIDLAVWGLPAECYYRALAAVSALSDGCEIDLVDPATASEVIRQAIALRNIPM